jgi:hypothetical protein
MQASLNGKYARDEAAAVSTGTIDDARLRVNIRRWTGLCLIVDMTVTVEVSHRDGDFIRTL